MLSKKEDHKKVNESKKKPIMAIDVHDYSNDPLAVKKLENAKKTIAKYGLPKELLNS